MISSLQRRKTTLREHPNLTLPGYKRDVVWCLKKPERGTWPRVLESACVPNASSFTKQEVRERKATVGKPMGSAGRVS